MTPAQSRLICTQWNGFQASLGWKTTGCSHLLGVGNCATVGAVGNLFCQSSLPTVGVPTIAHFRAWQQSIAATSASPAPPSLALWSRQYWARPAAGRDPRTLRECRARESLIYSALLGSCGVSLIQAPQREINPTAMGRRENVIPNSQS